MFPRNDLTATISEICQQSCGLPSDFRGLSHGLKNMPPACFSPRLRRGRPFEPHIHSQKKEALLMECFFFLGIDMGLERPTPAQPE